MGEFDDGTTRPSGGTTATATAVKSPRLAALAAMAGSLLEYYDYMLFATAAALIFPRVFFPDTNPVAGTLLSLASYGVAYLARPVGAVILGTVGDRLGRKTLLQFTIWLMGVATLAIGFLPSYAQIGIAAPVLLVLLRILQGFSTAAEGPAGAALALEHADDDRRAFNASWTISGVQGGQASASLVFIPVPALPDEALYSWGWRIPFWASALVLAFSYVVRRKVPETPEFEQMRTAEKTPRTPIVDLFKNDGVTVLRVVVAVFAAAPSSLATVFGLAYATSPEVGITRSTMLSGLAIGNLVAVFALPVWGTLADRIGRKPVWIGGAIASAFGFWGFLAAIQTARAGLIIVVTVVFLGIVYSAVNAIQASMFPEWFPTRTRVLGFAVGNQLGLLVFGFAPTIALGIIGGDVSNWGGVVVLVFALIALACVSVLSGPETRSVPTSALGRRARSTHDDAAETPSRANLP